LSRRVKHYIIGHMLLKFFTHALTLETKKTIELFHKNGIANVCGGAITGDFHDRIIRFKMYLTN